MFETKRINDISTGVVIWQSKNTQVAQGGFTLDDTNFPSGSIVPAGTPVFFDESTRLAKVYKSSVMQANATGTDTDYKVLKGSLLAVGMSVKSGDTASKEITAIDKTDTAFDKITLSATLGTAVKSGDSLFVEDASGNEPKGLLYSAVQVGSNNIAEITVVVHGTVYARRIVPVSKADRLKMPLIIFSESF